MGKWHLGYPEAYHPNKRGYDWFYGLLQGSRGYFPYDKPSPNRVILENSKPTPESGYVTDRFGDAACRFIKENKDTPFYLFVSFTAPHSPNQPKPEDKKRIAHISPKGRQSYAGLIVSLDDNVGKILKCLKQQGLDENTLVIFTNDNGGQTATGANNSPLKGKKGTLWEGGVRVPWAMRWPKHIQKGSTIDDPIIAFDIFPTVVEASGNPIKAEWGIDGRSFLPLLTGKKNTLPTRALHWRQHGSRGSIAMREGDWKLIYNRAQAGSKPELYNLKNDIEESQNLADKHPDVANQLITKMQQWEAQMVEPLWGPGSPGKPAKTKKNSQTTK
ncbi:sulfatase-like hydrolase/transferase [Rubritalea tangerina]|uniref:sulfatase-like hydrolase/transferase n=1 Tax=Rubritalea tangerina TaxID=430798 RepID=UPI00361EC664